jgi:threonine/homoserine/homoserine lactone efflux protein
MNWQLFSAFAAVTAVIVFSPGPIVTFLIATGASEGLAAALTSVVGTAFGSGLQIALIALALSWALANAFGLFELLRWLGAAYLIWLGIQSWRGAGREKEGAPGRALNIRRGFIVALTNPSGIAFYTAFLPQFVDPGLPAGPQLVAMCAASVLLGALSSTFWAAAAGLGRAWFITPARARWIARLSAGVLVVGGLWLLLANRPV